jgi:ankyrin repeat protein
VNHQQLIIFLQASCNGHAACVDALMTARAEPNIPNVAGQTACFIAAQQGHAHIIKLLKSASDVQMPSKEGSSPLHAAALGGHFECVVELICAGANVSVLNLQGQTPLQVAEANQHHHVAHLLREHMQGNSSSSCPAGGP